jgi:nicotinamide riboside kinase
MKIAIIGSHSTGKTTILRALVDTLSSKNIPLIIVDELARRCPFPINEATSYEAQAWIQHEQIEEETKQEQASSPETIIICDRSTLDNFAYFKRACPTQDLSSFEQQAIAHMTTYDAVFKTTMLDVEAKADGVRSIDQAFRTEIDQAITHLFERHQVPYVALPPTLDVDKHISVITDIINTKKTAN